MQLLESKVCIWETTVHIKAELDFFFFLPRQLNKANEQYCSFNKMRFIPYCLIFTATLGAYKGQDYFLFTPFPKSSPFTQQGYRILGKKKEFGQEFVLAPLFVIFRN